MELIEKLNALVWGTPALVLILGVGLYLSIRTGFVQLRLFPRALRSFVQKFRGGKTSHDGVSPYQALCTALAATVGIGNIAGVAGAIALGGPGSIFWMWICALFGMATKFAEATLAVRYSRKNADGERVGGPMHMIEQGLGKRYRWLAVLYCFFGVVAAFGVGNATQINALIGGINSVIIAFGGQERRGVNIFLGFGLALLIMAMLLGGAKRIGKVAERLVPFASVAYLLLGVGVLIARYAYIPAAFSAIIQGAFSPRAVTGGIFGSMFIALRIGVSRGTFTNEAGMGTAAIAHGAAQVEHPAEQGLMGIMEVFLDTVVICTMTALVILCSGVPIPYGIDQGIHLTNNAFGAVYGQWITVPIAIALCCFALATVLGWGLYGARCAQYLFGDQAWKPFVYLQAITVVLGAILNTGTVWLLSETVNGLMAIPNLLALALLCPELCRLTKNFTRRRNTKGGTYENLKNRTPVAGITYPKVPSSGGKGEGRWQENLSSEHRSA